MLTKDELNSATPECGRYLVADRHNHLTVIEVFRTRGAVPGITRHEGDNYWYLKAGSHIPHWMATLGGLIRTDRGDLEGGVYKVIG